MKQKEYLKDQHVISFINWIQPKLSNSFTHSYTENRNNIYFEFTSIYDAYKKYSWKNKNYHETNIFLIQSQENLNNAIKKGDILALKNTCIEIFKWGGVSNKNIFKIESIPNLLQYFLKVKQNLNPEIFDTAHYDEIIINSGFSKIYSVLISNYVIYDSRVGAALCLMVRKYLEENNIDIIPETLSLNFETGRLGALRNPNTARHNFKKISRHNHKSYILSNMKANWLFKGILDNTKSDFNKVSKSNQLRSLEAALFMIGYKVN